MFREADLNNLIQLSGKVLQSFRAMVRGPGKVSPSLELLSYKPTEVSGGTGDKHTLRIMPNS